MNSNPSKSLLRVRDLIMIIFVIIIVITFLPNKWFPFVKGPYQEASQDIVPAADKDKSLSAAELKSAFWKADFILRDTEFGFVIFFNKGGEVLSLNLDEVLSFVIQGDIIKWPAQTKDVSFLRFPSGYWTLENVFSQKPNSEIYEDSYDFVLYKLPDELGGKVVSARMSSLGESYLVRIPVNEFQKGLVYSFLNKAP